LILGIVLLLKSRMARRLSDSADADGASVWQI